MTDKRGVKKIILVILVLLGILSYIGVILTPYHFYRMAMKEGMDGQFFKLGPLGENYHKGSVYNFVRTKEISERSSSQWENLHFNDFVVPMPMEHPLFTLKPHFEKINSDYLFGYQLLDPRNKERARVLFYRPYEFKLEVHKHRLFEMPLFKNYILAQGMDKVWSDLFEKDLTKSEYLSSVWLRPFPDNILFWKLPIKEMVYDLFILSMRHRVLPQNLVVINYFKNSHRGLVEIVDSETKNGKGKSFKEEMIYVRVGRLVYPILFRSKLETPEIEAYRQRFLGTLTYKKSTPSSSIAIYSEYKNLSYEAKLKPAGMNLLFSALSHEKKSKAFVREMIQFLERGKSQKVILDSLYSYAYGLFGSSFSTFLANRKETQREKLFREMSEEQKAENDDILNMPLEDLPENFDSQEEKIKRYLQKAKDKGNENKEKKNVFIVD
jgi:hypothetical protein